MPTPTNREVLVNLLRATMAGTPRVTRMIPHLTASVVFLGLVACGKTEVPADPGAAAPTVSASAAAPVVPVTSAPAMSPLPSVLAGQSEEVQARYPERHPEETLRFFGIEPGMTVLEALPGGGWYSKILVPYLGGQGTLIGVDYSPALFPLFGFFSDESLAAKETWAVDWPAEARSWFASNPDDAATIDAFQFGQMPERFAGSMDAVVLVRALHNLARFEGQGGFLTEAIADMYRALKPGGVVGVVQHMAPEDAPDEWANGSAGYLKKSFVIARMEAGGFELMAETDINENPLDKPTVDDAVWRLPPTLAGADKDPEMGAKHTAIGESTRMTLLFRKPA